MATHPNRSGRKPGRNPTPNEIKQARIKAGLTQTQAAELIYSTMRTWQDWEGNPTHGKVPRMHPGLWELFQAKVKLLEKPTKTNGTLTPKQFRALRHQLGLSQARLAAELKVDVRQVKRWEAGDSPISGPVELAMKYLCLPLRLLAQPREVSAE